MSECDWNELLAFYFVPHCIRPHPARRPLGIPESRGELFDVLAALVDLPDDGRLFGQSKHAAVLLITAWQKQSGRVFNLWPELDYLYAFAMQSGGATSTWGSRETNPVFSFLMYFKSEFADDFELCEKNKMLAPFLVRRIGICHAQVENPTRRYLYHLCLAARKIVAAAPNSFSEARFDFDYQVRLVLGKRAKEAVIGDTRLTTESDWSYIKDLLFRDRTKLGAGGGGGEGAKKQRWLLLEHPPAYVYQEHMDVALVADPLAGFKPDDKQVDVCLSLSSRVPDKAEMLLAGEYDVDYFEERVDLLPASWFIDPWVARRHKRGRQEAQLMASRLQPWDSQCLTSSTVAQLLGILMSAKADPALGMIALSLLCGMNKRILVKIKVASASSHVEHNQSVTDHLVQGDRYFDSRTKILWWMNDRGSESEAGYIPVSLLVQMPLPEIIARHLPICLSEGASLFNSKDFTVARSLLRNLDEDGLGNVTLGRLVVTFESYFIGGAGLPELIADVIQGKERGHLKSQHYYVTFDWAHAVHQWHGMVESLVVCSGENSGGLSRRMVWRDGSHPGSTKEHAGAIGTPALEALREYIQQLLCSFPRNSEALKVSGFEAWNAYISYLYLLVALSTGRRPQRDPFPHLNDFDLERGRMYIADKYNRIFREARVIPMCATLVAALKQHRHVQARMYMLMTLKGLISEVSPGMPFLIDEENRELISVNPANVDRLCSCSWRGLRNGPRHFLLTRLHQVGVPQEAIDFLSGHRHEQREPEMSASPVSWKRLANELEEVIEREVVQFLGLEVPIVD